MPSPEKVENPEGAPEEKAAPVEDFKSMLVEKNTRIESLETRNDDLEGRVDSLQDSLDSALEEMALKGGSPEADEEEISGTEAPVASAPKSVEPKVLEGSKEGEIDTGVERQLERAIKDDLDFRERIELKEEMRDLNEELNDVLEVYPEANEDEILLGIEDGIEENNLNQVEALAKASHDKHLRLKEEIRESLKEELGAEISKEKEGGISVPQSPGTPTASPKSDAGEQAISSPLTEDDEWSNALKKARVEGLGA